MSFTTKVIVFALFFLGLGLCAGGAILLGIPVMGVAIYIAYNALKE